MIKPAALLMVFASLQAHAEQWETISTNSEFVVQIDMASLVKQSDTVQVWKRDLYFNTFYIENKAINKMVQKLIFNCTKRKFTLDGTYLYFDDSIISSGRSPIEQLDVIPGTNSSSIFNRVCMVTN